MVSTSENIIVIRNNLSATDHQRSSRGGAVYIRWGRKACSGNGTELLYWGKCINDTHFYVVVDKVFLKITDPATMFFIFFFIIVLRFRYCQII